MKFLPLIVRNLFRKKIRTTLTILSIAVAMFLFGLLAVINTAFTAGLDVAGADRVVVIGRNGVIQPLPLRYREQIASMPGVTDVAYASWFGGVYQDERNFFAQFAIDDESYLRIYSEFVIPEEQMKAYLADREGAIVGRKTAKRFGWKIGDRIPLKGTIFPGTWEFNVRAIYSGRRPQDDESGFMFRAKYLRGTGPCLLARAGGLVRRADQGPETGPGHCQTDRPAFLQLERRDQDPARGGLHRELDQSRSATSDCS